MPDRKKATLIGVSVFVIIALALALWSFLSAVVPHESRFEAKPLETEETQFVRAMVAKANGDPNRLTMDERSRMDQITKGFTEVVIKSGPLK